jgi:hypothetical protein
MTVESTVQTRLTTAGTIEDAAVAASDSFMTVFTDLEGVRAPVVTPAEVSFTPGTGSIDLPSRPDGTRLENAVTALSEIDGEIADFETLEADLEEKFSEVDTVFQDATIALKDLVELSKQIVIPTKNDFLFQGGEYRAEVDVDDTLRLVIETELEKNGEGAPSDVETAMYEKGQDRREIKRQEDIDESFSALSGRGFTKPQGHHMKAVLMINEKYRQDDNLLSKNIMIAQTKLSLENKWRIINAGISYNQLAISLADNTARRALETASFLFGLDLDLIKYRLTFLAQQVDLGKAEVSAILDAKKNDVDQYAITLVKIKKKLDGLIAKAKGYIESYRTDGQVYSYGIEAAGEESRFKQSENILSLEVQKANITNGIIAAQNSLRSYMATSEIQFGAAKTGGDFKREIAVGILRSLATVVQYDKSGELSSQVE